MPKAKRSKFRVVYMSNDVAVEDLMTQLLLSKGFASVGVKAAIQLCCELLPHVPNIGAPVQWN
jgi:hypothetical protein